MNTSLPTPEADALTKTLELAHRFKRQRDDALEQLASERALADLLAKQLNDCLKTQEDMDVDSVRQAIDTWEGARNE